MILTLIGSEGVGKSQTGYHLAKLLRGSGHATAHLDGDLMRAITGNGDYSARGRRCNAFATGNVVRGLHKSGYNVIISAVFPLLAVRRSFQHACGGDVFWVHLKYTPFVQRLHGAVEVEALHMNEAGFTMDESSTIDDRARKILNVVDGCQRSWLSVLDVPITFNDERIGNGGGI